MPHVGSWELGEEEQLVFSAQVEPRAFVGLYQRYLPPVYRYVRARSLGDDEASELASVTFERAFRGLRTYRSNPNGPLPWLLRIARNAAVDEHRRRWTTVDHRSPDLNVLVMPTPSPEEVVLRIEQRETLRDLLRALPEPQGDAIVLRYACSLTAAQIGSVIGRTAGATQKLITRGMQTLREAYRE